METKEKEFLSEEELSDVSGGWRVSPEGTEPSQKEYDKCIDYYMKEQRTRTWCEVKCKVLKPR